MQELAGVQAAPGAGGVVPPVGSIEAEFKIAPAVLGAVVFNVNVALPLVGSAAVSVTEHTSAGAVPVQLIADTPLLTTAFT